MGPKTFQRVVDYLFPIRDKFRDGAECNKLEDKETGKPAGWGEQFDYPDYEGLSKTVSNVLSSEAVDALQDILQGKYMRKRDFARAFKNRMFDLGEKGKYMEVKI